MLLGFKRVAFRIKKKKKAQTTREDLVAFWKNNPEPLGQLKAMSEVARQEVEDAFKERAKEIKQGEN